MYTGDPRFSTPLIDAMSPIRLIDVLLRRRQQFHCTRIFDRSQCSARNRPSNCANTALFATPERRRKCAVAQFSAFPKRLNSTWFIALVRRAHSPEPLERKVDIEFQHWREGPGCSIA